MRLYRLARTEFARDLAGTGCVLGGSRWSSPGRAAVFFAQHRSLALCEVLVHTAGDQRRKHAFSMVQVDLPDRVHLIDALPPARWRTPRITAHTRIVGDRFLAEGLAFGLRLPSVIVPQEWNYLLNPSHPAMKELRIVDVEPYDVDERLLPTAP